MTRKTRNDLRSIYYTPFREASFTSADKLKKVYHGKQNVKKWLKAQKTQQLHKPIRINFRRAYTFSSDVDYLWQIDLTFLRDLKRFNRGNEYLLTCIDVFSKYAWVAAVKTKTAESILEAFKTFLLKGRKPVKLQSDKGGEFENRVFQNYCKEKNIHFYTSKNYDIKAAVVERFNRTFKTKMYKFFTAKKTKNYITNLQQLVNSYNNTRHRSIGMTPTEASNIKSLKDKIKLFNKLYPLRKRDKVILKKGDYVLVTKLRKTFRKGYIANWSKEKFIIYKVFRSNPTLYQLVDLKGTIIEGRFYIQELQKI